MFVHFSGRSLPLSGPRSRAAPRALKEEHGQGRARRDTLHLHHRLLLLHVRRHVLRSGPAAGRAGDTVVLLRPRGHRRRRALLHRQRVHGPAAALQRQGQRAAALHAHPAGLHPRLAHGGAAAGELRLRAGGVHPRGRSLVHAAARDGGGGRVLRARLPAAALAHYELHLPLCLGAGAHLREDAAQDRHHAHALPRLPRRVHVRRDEPAKLPHRPAREQRAARGLRRGLRLPRLCARRGGGGGELYHAARLCRLLCGALRHRLRPALALLLQRDAAGPPCASDTAAPGSRPQARCPPCWARSCGALPPTA